MYDLFGGQESSKKRYNTFYPSEAKSLSGTNVLTVTPTPSTTAVNPWWKEVVTVELALEATTTTF